MNEIPQETSTSPRPGGQFSRFAGAVGLANVADGIAIIAWAWTASLLTRDPLLIALLPAALRIPWVVFALPSGILADRADRQRLVVMCDLIRACVYAAAGAAIVLNMPLAAAPPHSLVNPVLYNALLGFGFIIGCAEVARDNAAQTMLPAIVAPSHLERANGQLQSIETIGNSMLGPATGSFLIAILLPLPFFVIAFSVLLAALVTASLKGSFRARKSETRAWQSELSDGFRFVVGNPMLRVLVLITGFWNFFAEMAIIALVLHVQENLKAGAMTYGFILAIGAVGGVAGGVLVAPLLKRFSYASLAQWMNFVAAPLFVAIAFAPSSVIVGAAMFFFSLSGVIWNTLSISYRQRVVPDEIRGRVNSVYRLFAWGMMPLGLVVSGLVVRWAEGFMVRGTALLLPFLIAAAGIALVAIFSWRPLDRGFRSYEKRVKVESPDSGH